MKKKAFCIIITLCLLALLVSCSADKASEKNGITHFINLGDSDDALAEYEGYSESYYKTVNHIAVEAGVNPAEQKTNRKATHTVLVSISFLSHAQADIPKQARQGKE